MPLGGGDLRTKDHVFDLEIDGERRAYPTELLTAQVVVNDELAGEQVVIIAPNGDLTQQGLDLVAAATRIWKAGAEIRAYAGGLLLFAAGADAQTVIDEDGGVWQVTEEALLGPNGEQLERLPGHLAYWFGWFNFFPDSSVYPVEP